MKKIEAIIRQEKLEEVKAVLDDTFHISGMTVMQVLGHGNQKGVAEFVRGQKIIPTLLPKVALCLVVTDEQVEVIAKKIMDTCYTGEVGDGKIFIYDVADVIRIRTGERGLDAI
ncbi:P-II family nitrogen regulator [Enterococcus saccharolyticus]|uniref:Transcriptional regulator n=1 Tax=Candidatus Enterococcus willemsii TaxID=1857215 RepID=A0ABQ6Z0J7_9ENTE|nr:MULTISPECIES: P-II family nitrogen regulator [Enterococcus]KAF1304080.1 transcriptional regulator [Enterococcus sp. CU12B]MCD5002059.1 P-II family nitrogen regulator [Enterococcus saccharolyticus]